jgi:predicted GIY-YIG superfamily endonuclease
MTTAGSVPIPVVPEAEITEESATALYRLYDAHGDLLYIGATDNLKGRFNQHRTEKPWWGEVARKTAAWYATRAEAFAAEDHAIACENPRHNIRSTIRAGVRTPRPALDITGLPEWVGVREAAQLAGVARATWTAYAARGQAPAAGRRNPDTGRQEWSPAAIAEWLATRPGPGTRTDLRNEAD